MASNVKLVGLRVESNVIKYKGGPDTMKARYVPSPLGEQD